MNKKATIITSGWWKTLLLDLVINIAAPNPFCYGLKIHSYCKHLFYVIKLIFKIKPYYYSVNDILSLI